MTPEQTNCSHVIEPRERKCVSCHAHEDDIEAAKPARVDSPIVPFDVVVCRFPGKFNNSEELKGLRMAVWAIEGEGVQRYARCQWKRPGEMMPALQDFYLNDLDIELSPSDQQLEACGLDQETYRNRYKR